MMREKTLIHSLLLSSSAMALLFMIHGGNIVQAEETTTSHIEFTPKQTADGNPEASQNTLLTLPTSSTEKEEQKDVPFVQPNDSKTTENLTFPLTADEYKKISATDLAQLVRDKKVTPHELVDLAYGVIDETNPKLNNVITEFKDRAYKQADSMTSPNEDQPFYGVPILIKGLTHTIKGGENSEAIPFMKDVKASSDGTYVKNLVKLGFIPLGQTAFPEMGWVNVTNSKLYGVTHNPWDLTKNPGGSSGGSAAGVAIGQVPIASANDGGGSIRIPSSWSGLIGYFPTGNLIQGNSNSSFQLENFAVAETMEDVINLATALKNPKAKLTPDRLEKDKPIAYSLQTPAGTPLSDDAKKAVLEAVDFLTKQGYTLKEVNYPIDGKQMMMDYYTNAAAVAGVLNTFAKRYLGRDLQEGDVSLLSWALYQTGKKLTSEDVKAAREDLNNFRNTMAKFYETYQAFLTPTNAYPAPAADYDNVPDELVETMKDMSKLSKEEALQVIYDQWLPAWTLTPYTQLSNVTSLPSITLPTYVTEQGLPMGIMFQADSFHDNVLMDLGNLFEANHLLKLLQDRKVISAYELTPAEVKTPVENDHKSSVKPFTELTQQDVLKMMEQLKERTENKVNTDQSSKEESIKTSKVFFLPFEEAKTENKKTSLTFKTKEDQDILFKDSYLVSETENKSQKEESKQPLQKEEKGQVTTKEKKGQLKQVQDRLPQTGFLENSALLSLGSLLFLAGGTFLVKKQNN